MITSQEPDKQASTFYGKSFKRTTSQPRDKQQVNHVNEQLGPLHTDQS